MPTIQFERRSSPNSIGYYPHMANDGDEAQRMEAEAVASRAAERAMWAGTGAASDQSKQLQEGQTSYGGVLSTLDAGERAALAAERTALAAERTALAAEQQAERSKHVWVSARLGLRVVISLGILGLIDAAIATMGDENRASDIAGFFLVVLTTGWIAGLAGRIGPKLDPHLSAGLYRLLGAVVGLVTCVVIARLSFKHSGSNIAIAFPISVSAFALGTGALVFALGALKPKEDASSISTDTQLSIARAWRWLVERLVSPEEVPLGKCELEPPTPIVSPEEVSLGKCELEPPTPIAEMAQVFDSTDGGGNKLNPQAHQHPLKHNRDDPKDTALAGRRMRTRILVWLVALLFGLALFMTIGVRVILWEIDRTQELDDKTAMLLAQTVGVLATTLSVAIPLGLWLVIRVWKPQSRWGYGLRFGLWPAVFLSYILGGPIGQAAVSVEAKSIQRLEKTSTGFVVLAGCMGLIFFVIGYIRANDRVFPTERD